MIFFFLNAIEHLEKSVNSIVIVKINLKKKIDFSSKNEYVTMCVTNTTQRKTMIQKHSFL